MALAGSCAFFGRHVSYRNAIKNIYNLCNSSLLPRTSTGIIARGISETDVDYIVDEGELKTSGKKLISKAMKAYLKRAKEHDDFMKTQHREYEIGKRHLANMMGQSPETFTQEDVNAAIKYLFPSGLFEPKARPIMDNPMKIFPPKKSAEFDESGRPFNSFFYTTKPNYFNALYDIVEETEKLNKIEDEEMRKGLLPNAENQIKLYQSAWVKQDGLERIFLEQLQTSQYEYFITALERLVAHPYSAAAEDLVTKYRKKQNLNIAGLIIPPLEYNEQGRPYIVVKNAWAKSASACVTLWGNGTGQFNINGQDITYFERRQYREQVRDE